MSLHDTDNNNTKKGPYNLVTCDSSNAKGEHRPYESIRRKCIIMLATVLLSVLIAMHSL